VVLNCSLGGGRGSGSLIRETTTGRPLGIYIGQVEPSEPPPGEPAISGIGTAITQLEAIMDLEVYE
jgi:hypothetical protein